MVLISRLVPYMGLDKMGFRDCDRLGFLAILIMKTILTIGKKEDDMRWYMRIIASVALGTVFLSLEASELTDQEVKIMLIDSGRFMHDSSAAREMFLSARAACGVDTNRFSRILLELAETNEVRVSQRMIRLLGRYGTSSALPFCTERSRTRRIP